MVIFLPFNPSKVIAGLIEAGSPSKQKKMGVTSQARNDKLFWDTF